MQSRSLALLQLCWLLPQSAPWWLIAAPCAGRTRNLPKSHRLRAVRLRPQPAAQIFMMRLLTLARRVVSLGNCCGFLLREEEILSWISVKITRTARLPALFSLQIKANSAILERSRAGKLKLRVASPCIKGAPRLLFTVHNRFMSFSEPEGFQLVKNFVLQASIIAAAELLLLLSAPIPVVAFWTYSSQSTDSTAAPAQSGDESSSLIAKGFELLARKDPLGAEAAFRKAIDFRPENADAHRGLSRALWEQGKGNAALREQTIAAQLDPANADAHIELAKIAWALSMQPDTARDGPGRNSP